jgi:hypothetical protein
VRSILRFHNVASLTRTEHECPWCLVSFTDSSWRHFDTHNSTVLRLGTSRVWNRSRKPHCVAVIDFFINNSTAPVFCCTGQRSISTKHRRAFYTLCTLYTTEVSIVAPHSGKDGNHMSKTVLYFWHNLYKRGFLPHIQYAYSKREKICFFISTNEIIEGVQRGI